MANHRPKSLSELNHVYDKALKAQRAIKEGSRSLAPDEVPAPVQEPTQSIFDELSKQAAQTKKTEVYDSEIADIANDFLKRYAKSEPRKAHSAPKELKRPAPSIQSLYHAPVKAFEEPADDIPMNLQSDIAFSDTAAITQSIPAVKPKTPEELMQEMTQRIILPVEEPEEESAPEEIAETPQAPAQPVIHTAPTQPHVAPSVIAPAARMSSEERSDLIKEYLRVMSDDDDDEYFDDDDEYSKPKKGGLWSRLTKRRQIIEDEASAEYNEDTEGEEYTDDADMSADVYSSYGEEQETYPHEEEDEEAPVSEDVPMSLSDYLEADFDYADDTQEDISSQEEETYEEEPFEEEVVAAEEYEEIPEEAFNQEPSQEEAVIIPEEAYEVLPTEEIQEDAEEIIEEAIEIPVEEADEVLPESEDEEEPEEIIPEEEAEEEEIIIPEEEIEPTEEIIPTEEHHAEETADDSPTAGMVFDDIFSVSDESKRSYTGGDWSTSPEDKPEAQEEIPEDEAEEYYEDETETETIRPVKAVRPKKKRSLASKIILSLILIVLTACTALVSVIGSVIAVDTGKLFSDGYRAFSATQDFSLSGVYAGDLVITEDSDQSIAQGDSFVYVNYDNKQFMVGKHRGNTYSITGETLIIAENEAGRVLVLVEDTLGTVKTTYSSLGRILGPISKNYIIIDAVLLVLIIAILLILIVPTLKKDNKLSQDNTRQEAADEKEDSGAYSAETSYEDSDEEEEDEDEFDPYDYDTDDIEEGLFSGI